MFAMILRDGEAMEAEPVDRLYRMLADEFEIIERRELMRELLGDRCVDGVAFILTLYAPASDLPLLFWMAAEAKEMVTADIVIEWPSRLDAH